MQKKTVRFQTVPVTEEVGAILGCAVCGTQSTALNLKLMTGLDAEGCLFFVGICYVHPVDRLSVLVSSGFAQYAFGDPSVLTQAMG